MLLGQSVVPCRLEVHRDVWEHHMNGRWRLLSQAVGHGSTVPVCPGLRSLLECGLARVNNGETRKVMHVCFLFFVCLFCFLRPQADAT